MFNDNENLEKLEHWERKIEEMHYVSDRIGSWRRDEKTSFLLLLLLLLLLLFCHEIVLPLGSRIS